MLTDLQRDTLRVITELSDGGKPPSGTTIATELGVYYSDVCGVLQGLQLGDHVRKDGPRWYPLTRAELPPDEEFVGFFEDVGLVKEFTS